MCLYPVVVVAELGAGAGAGVVVRAGGGTPGRKVAVEEESALELVLEEAQLVDLV